MGQSSPEKLKLDVRGMLYSNIKKRQRIACDTNHPLYTTISQHTLWVIISRDIMLPLGSRLDLQKTNQTRRKKTSQEIDIPNTADCKGDESE
jgi:hypothetical protein